MTILVLLLLVAALTAAAIYGFRRPDTGAAGAYVTTVPGRFERPSTALAYNCWR